MQIRTSAALGGKTALTPYARLQQSMLQQELEKILEDTHTVSDKRVKIHRARMR